MNLVSFRIGKNGKAPAKPLIFGVLVFIFITILPAYAEFEIQLKDKKKITVSEYWVEDGFLYYIRADSQIGIPLSTIANIYEIDPETDEKTLQCLEASQNNRAAFKEKSFNNSTLELCLPPFSKELHPRESRGNGRGLVRIVNDSIFKVVVGMRSSDKGINFIVLPRSEKSLWFWEGHYSMYYVVEDEPDRLRFAEDFQLQIHQKITFNLKMK